MRQACPTALVGVAALVLLLPACQTAPVSESGTAMATTEAELMAEATAFGAAQGAVGVATAFDPTGVSGTGAMVAGRAAPKAWRAQAPGGMEAAQGAAL